MMPLNPSLRVHFGEDACAVRLAIIIGALAGSRESCCLNRYRRYLVQGQRIRLNGHFYFGQS